MSDSELTGWIWAGDHGWISLSCQNTSSCGTNDYGVINDGKGNLSGFAWGERLGWINFRMTGGSDCCVANGTPGCSNSMCEAAICSENALCCNDHWDSVCAVSASAEPGCSSGCGVGPWGVRIHGFTGEFSGFAWTEHDGWINFGTAPVAESHQIETSWRCPDPDADAVCSASDSCPGWPNTGQGTVLFDQIVVAATKVDFIWAVSVEWQLARGTFSGSADIGTFAGATTATGTGAMYSDTEPDPHSGSGYWYLFRPDCLAGSYATGTASEQEGRDDALIP